MSKFPNGNFTIVNNETGRCVRVRLGQSTDVSDWQLGTKYLQTVTEKPILELGVADGSPATAWWFSTIEDGSERQPFNQIVSHAVGEYQNIGNHCIWLYANKFNDAEEQSRAKKQFAYRLESLSEDLREKLGALIPQEWKAQQTKDRAGYLRAWEERRSKHLKRRAAVDAELEAWATDTEPLSAEQLAKVRQLREEFLDWREEGEAARERGQKIQPGRDLTREENALVMELEPRTEAIRARAEELIPKFEEGRLKDLPAARQHTALAQQWQDWHSACVLVAFNEESQLVPRDEKFVSALRAYLQAVAEEGIRPQADASGARTEMYGSGASRKSGSTYRWVFDGTHIYGADSKTVPAERTYWTDDNGYLVGRNKGGPGQTWTLASWKAPAPAARAAAPALLLTGLFGPIADLFTG